MATSLYHPTTVARSLDHDGSGPEPGLKDQTGQWDLRPHRNRVQHVDETTLKTWHALLETELCQCCTHGWSTRSTSPVPPCSRPWLAASGSVLWILSSVRLAREERPHEGLLRERVGRPESWDQVILQGPHFHVGAPFYKSPNAAMASNKDWSTVDLETLRADAIPVTSYKPRGTAAKYDLAYTHWGEDSELAARDYYRVAWRRMAANTGERTLIPVLFRPASHT